VYLISLPLKVDAVSEELRLTSIGSAPLQWTVGAYYRRTEDDQNQIYQVSSLPGTLFFLNHNLSRSWAAFGDASYRFDRLTLGAGLRYFEADQETSSGFALGTPAALGPVLAGKFDSLDPRLYAQYELTDRINTYASAAKGFRSGGFNALNQPDYAPESVWTYELGVKMSLLQGRLTSNLALFYSDYKDYQILGRITAPSGQILTITSNAGNARLNGIEWDFAWRSTNHWTLGLNGNYVDSEFYEINASLPTNEVGDPLDFFPKYTYTASIQRDFARSNGRGGFARVDYSQQGRATFRNRRNGPLWFSESDIINLLNFNVTLQWNEHFSFGIFAQNLLNERGYTGAEVVTENTVRARPRTYGIQIGLDFD
jgi:iron complex outermembrane receptor protein